MRRFEWIFHSLWALVRYERGQRGGVAVCLARRRLPQRISALVGGRVAPAPPVTSLQIP